MSCFADLFARYPDKMMDLCVDESAAENRLYCWVDFPLECEPCRLCDRHMFDDGTFDWHNRDVCDSEECRRLWAWLWVSRAEGGYARRGAVKKLFGKSIYEIPHTLRREAILAAMLLVEVKEKANAGKPRLRVAA